MISRFSNIGAIVIVLSMLLVGGLPKCSAAATDDFTINLFVGTDITPPTTPVLQSVTPVTSTQINILWSVSTDDVALAGYRVYRDGIVIATTTLTSFSDSGLAASTFYSYSVDAFDTFNNVSTTSNAIATSTLAIPATTTATGTAPSRSGTRVPSLQTFSVLPTQTSAQITWQTYGVTSYVLKWGRTTSYDSGSVSSNLFSQTHITEIDGLEPGTKYFFELSATDPFGATRVLKVDSFYTEAAISAFLPANVEGFGVDVSGMDVSLQWRNHALPEGVVVRVVRSHLYYPDSITAGSLVYEGRGEFVLDVNALAERSPQYYTAFVITKEGLVSSGAIAVAGLLLPPLPSSVVENPTVEIGDESILRAFNVMVLQGTQHFTLDATKPLQADTDYVISIPVMALKPGLKSIIVSVQNPSNQREVSRFLLKMNQVGDAYEATILAPLVTGSSRLQVEVFDYTAKSVRQISTTVTFIRNGRDLTDFSTSILGLTWRALILWWVVGVIVIVLVWLWLLLRYRREDNR